MAKTMLRHPAETPFLNRDGTITIEWSAWYTMVDKVANPLTQVPADDLNNLGSTLSGLNTAVTNAGYDDLAGAIEGIQYEISYLAAQYSDLLIQSYVKADLPTSARVNKLVRVTDAVAGDIIAFWDGGDWRGVDGNLVT
jgi:hypothetical protein